MPKAILELEKMPADCLCCTLSTYKEYGKKRILVCIASEDEAEVNIFTRRRYDNCPLKPVEEKKATDEALRQEMEQYIELNEEHKRARIWQAQEIERLKKQVALMKEALEHVIIAFDPFGNVKDNVRAWSALQMARKTVSDCSQ